MSHYHYIDLKSQEPKRIYPLDDRFSGVNPDGDRIGFTNYYMMKNGAPFFGISGELHFSRVSEKDWDDEILKMKMCGVNIVSTYVIWIHHEEEEGVFRFDGNRNIRKFIEICKKHGMYVIARIGPFVHGEVRNGGIPDWMYGKPFEVRSMDEGFLFYVKRLFDQYAKQLRGLYFADGGPVIAAQIDNEYMHSSAPWEITTGISNEWVNPGADGDAYMLKIKELARAAGIATPFYTATAWGGAAAPADEMMPLWGGYAFWPWIFYSRKGEHPATPEYIYRDNHNNSVKRTYNFEPAYEPESRPYACCEMGGGMMCSYNYRFRLPYESIDAMANIKIGSGCNFLGYYMFRGGTNPKGRRTPFLNESQVTKISYDYQAAIGEFGQIRPSYRRLKALHLFAQSFTKELCLMKTVLPGESQDISPEDCETLRYCVRFKGESGFIFINNYQDHAQTKEKTDESIELELPSGRIAVRDICIAGDETAILPFNMDIGGYRLVYSLTQPLTYLSAAGRTYYFFFVPKGMKPFYVFDSENISLVNGQKTDGSNEKLSVGAPAHEISSILLDGAFGEVCIVTLPREDSLNFYKLNIDGQETAVLCDSALLYDGMRLFMETTKSRNVFLSFPDVRLSEESVTAGKQKRRCRAVEKEYQVFRGFEMEIPDNLTDAAELPFKRVGPARYTIDIPKDFLYNAKDALLQIEYIGDIGHAFINGDMISDNFCNGDVWEIGLKEYGELLKEHPVTICITPIKEGANVNVDSAMAARLEEVKGITGELLRVKLQPVYEIVLKDASEA